MWSVTAGAESSGFNMNVRLACPRRLSSVIADITNVFLPDILGSNEKDAVYGSFPLRRAISVLSSVNTTSLIGLGESTSTLTVTGLEVNFVVFGSTIVTLGISSSFPMLHEGVGSDAV